MSPLSSNANTRAYPAREQSKDSGPRAGVYDYVIGPDHFFDRPAESSKTGLIEQVFTMFVEDK